MFSVSLTERENRYLKTVFVVASLVYAVLVIKSLNENQLEGYYHTNVQIFNTEFDPNFIGIPLTAAMALLLDQILRKKNKLLAAIMYMVIAYAVIYTASRGSFIAGSVSSGLVLVLFLLRANIPVWKKLVYLAIPVVAILLIAAVVKVVLPVEWERLTNISASEDNGRLALWETAIEDWLQKPLFGNGLGHAQKIHGKASHNTYLQILSETGLVGAVLFCGFLVPLVIKAYKTDTALFCVLMGVFVQILFLDALSNRCLWILLCWITMLPASTSQVRRA
jgi:O-antigen ligase